MRSIFISIVVVLVMSTSFCAALADETEAEYGKLEFSGLLEEELGYITAEGDDENDFALAKVELGAELLLSPNVCGHVLFLYEQDENDDNIVVDEGTIGLKIPVTLPVELSLCLGRMKVPFGQFNSHFVSDPFTLEIGETSQIAPLILASHDMVEGSVAIYNEEVEVEGKNNTQIGDMAARIAAFVPEGALGEDTNFSLGGSFITNIAGTDGLTDILGSGLVSERAMGLGGFVSFSAMGVFLEGEVIIALGDMEVPNGEKFRPRAFNVELGYSLPDLPVEIAAKFDQLSEDSDNATNRFGGVVSFGLFDEVASLALEFLRTDDDEATANSIVCQLAIGF